MIKLAEDLTYRQLVIIDIVWSYNYGVPIGSQRLDHEYGGLSELKAIGIVSEIFDLCRRSVLFSTTAFSDIANINPSLLYVAGVDDTLYKLMELSTIPLDDITQNIIDVLTQEPSHVEGAPVTAGKFLAVFGE